MTIMTLDDKVICFSIFARQKMYFGPSWKQNSNVVESEVTSNVLIFGDRNMRPSYLRNLCRSGQVVLFVRSNGTIATGLMLTVWVNRKSRAKKPATTPIAPSECYGFRVVELTAAQEHEDF